MKLNQFFNSFEKKNWKVVLSNFFLFFELSENGMRNVSYLEGTFGNISILRTKRN